MYSPVGHLASGLLANGNALAALAGVRKVADGLGVALAVAVHVHDRKGVAPAAQGGPPLRGFKSRSARFGAARENQGKLVKVATLVVRESGLIHHARTPLGDLVEFKGPRQIGVGGLSRQIFLRSECVKAHAGKAVKSNLLPQILVGVCCREAAFCHLRKPRPVNHKLVYLEGHAHANSLCRR